MLPLRLVLDTNIAVSAALRPDGLRRTVLLLAIAKPARLYVSTPIFSEYRTVLSRRNSAYVEDSVFSSFNSLRTAPTSSLLAIASNHHRPRRQHLPRMPGCRPRGLSR